jgi:hypothetical protein
MLNRVDREPAIGTEIKIDLDSKTVDDWRSTTPGLPLNIAKQIFAESKNWSTTIIVADKMFHLATAEAESLPGVQTFTYDELTNPGFYRKHALQPQEVYMTDEPIVEETDCFAEEDPLMKWHGIPSGKSVVLVTPRGILKGHVTSRPIDKVRTALSSQQRKTAAQGR